MNRFMWLDGGNAWNLKGIPGKQNADKLVSTRHLWEYRLHTLTAQTFYKKTRPYWKKCYLPLVGKNSGASGLSRRFPGADSLLGGLSLGFSTKIAELATISPKLERRALLITHWVGFLRQRTRASVVSISTTSLGMRALTESILQLHQRYNRLSQSKKMYSCAITRV